MVPQEPERGLETMSDIELANRIFSKPEALSHIEKLVCGEMVPREPEHELENDVGY